MERFESQREAYMAGTFLDQFKEGYICVLRKCFSMFQVMLRYTKELAAERLTVRESSYQLIIATEHKVMNEVLD